MLVVRALKKLIEASWVFLLAAVVYLGGMIFIGYCIEWWTGNKP